LETFSSLHLFLIAYRLLCRIKHQMAAANVASQAPLQPVVAGLPEAM
jgi:hypothetical protein